MPTAPDPVMPLIHPTAPASPAGVVPSSPDGAPAAPGVIVPISPGAVPVPDAAVLTRAQAISAADQAQVRTNIGAELAGPVFVVPFGVLPVDEYLDVVNIDGIDYLTTTDPAIWTTDTGLEPAASGAWGKLWSNAGTWQVDTYDEGVLITEGSADTAGGASPLNVTWAEGQAATGTMNGLIAAKVGQKCLVGPAVDGSYDSYTAVEILPSKWQQDAEPITSGAVTTALGYTPQNAATAGSLRSSVQLNIELPVYDGNQSVIHFDGYHSHTLVFGYNYWSAYTPYPPANRELIAVAASKDGVNWEVPRGMPNPIVTSSVAIDPKWDVIGDTDITVLANGSLAVWFIATNAGVEVGVFQMFSDDGVTWSAPVEIFTEDFDLGQPQSPAVVVEADDTLTMFYVRIISSARTLWKRTADATGTTWSEPIACTIPASGGLWTPWHPDAILVDGVYHMLMCCGKVAYTLPEPEHFLVHWTSTNGTDFTGPTTPCIPELGDSVMRDVYRSSLMLSPEGTGFDVYMVGFNAGTTLENAAQIRVHRFRNLLLNGAETPAMLAISSAPSSSGGRHSFAPRHCVLDADHSVTENIGLQSVPVVNLSAGVDGIPQWGGKILSGETVAVSVIAYLTDVSESGNYQFTFAGATLSGIWNARLNTIGGTNVFNYTLSGAAGLNVTGVAAGASHVLQIDAILTASTDGYVGLYFAQATSDTDAITIKKGSTISISRIP